MTEGGGVRRLVAMRTMVFCAWMLSPLLHAERADVSGELAEILKLGPVPGMAAAFIADGKITAAGAAGLRMAGGEEKVLLGDRFHLGSCTKSMTATLAALMVGDGKLEWDQTVEKSFPGVEIHPSRAGTTLRQLLSNTSGCATEVPGELWMTLWKEGVPEEVQRDLLVEGILTSEAAHAPGTRYEYSNAGFSIAGAMLEKAAGKPYDQLLRQRLFEPLGMRSAGFGAPATVEAPDQPHGHTLVNGKAVPVPPGHQADNPAAITPAGRVHASILDFARYASLHLGTEERPALTKAQLDLLHQPVAPSKDYALGWQVVERPWAGGTALTHTGTNTMFFAVMWLSPSRKFAAVAACNLGGNDGAKACDDAVGLLIHRHLKEAGK